MGAKSLDTPQEPIKNDVKQKTLTQSVPKAQLMEVQE
jgi:hypothetical protein